MKPEDFATKIRKDSWHRLKTKVGETNGQTVVHIIDLEADDKRVASTTVATMGQWLVHPLNRLQKPRKGQTQYGLAPASLLTQKAAEAVS